MKIELSHDLLAKKVFEMASIEDKARTKAERFIRDKYAYYETTPSLYLSSYELSYIKPYEKDLQLTENEKAFIETSRKKQSHVKLKRTLQNALALVCGAAALISGWGFFEHSRANTNETLAKQQAIALYQFSDKVRTANSLDDLHDLKQTAEVIQKRQKTEFEKIVPNKLQIPVITRNPGNAPTNATNSTGTGLISTTLEGFIVDEINQPIQNAIISIGSAQLKTDEKGYFYTTLIIGGELETSKIGMKVEKQGHQSISRNLKLSDAPFRMKIELLME